MNPHLFENELHLLNRILPGYTCDNCSTNFRLNLPAGFINTLYNLPETDAPVAYPLLTPSLFDMESLFQKEDKAMEESNWLNEKDNGTEELTINALVANFGRDAFGLYLPFHYYKSCWGIYLFKEVINQRVSELYTQFSDIISYKHLKQFYYYAVYRHELFHYQVERFCTKLELALKTTVYGQSRLLNMQVANSENWLEEALAEASVLNSRLVGTRTKVHPAIIQRIYKYDLQFMPPGYRDYHCRKFGGPKKAHLLFASQLVENSLKPAYILTPMLSIKQEYNSIDKEVPTYLVSGFNNLRRVNM